MNISRQQIDKLIVGTNDVSYVEPDISPTGTAVLNGPVYIGKPTAAPSSYEGFLNVASNAATQSPIDRQAKAEANFAIKTDDLLAKQIRTFCKENKCNINQFIKTVLRNYFNDELKTTIQSRKLVRVSYFNSRKGG